MPRADRCPRRCTTVPLVVAALLLAACGGSDDPGPPDDPSSTTVAAAPSSTVTPAPSEGGDSEGDALAPAVEPGSVPEGYRPLRAPGIGVGVAVPEGWTITDLRGDDLTEAQAEAAGRDPQLSGLLADGGALLDRARTLVAIGPPGSSGTPLVTLLQLPTVVAAVPADVEDQVRSQVESYGAAEVRVSRVAVAGRSGTEALEVRAVLSLEGSDQQLVVRVVPASIGLAVVTVRAESSDLDSILRSLAAA